MARRGRGLGYVAFTKRDLKHQMTVKCGSHYWDPGTMRFFNSRLLNVYPNSQGKFTCFTTSEKGPDGIRKYTVKKLTGCEVDDYGGFQAHRTSAAAKKAAQACARGMALSGARGRRRWRR